MGSRGLDFHPDLGVPSLVERGLVVEPNDGHNAYQEFKMLNYIDPDEIYLQLVPVSHDERPRRVAHVEILFEAYVLQLMVVKPDYFNISLYIDRTTNDPPSGSLGTPWFTDPFRIWQYRVVCNGRDAEDITHVPIQSVHVVVDLDLLVHSQECLTLRVYNDVPASLDDIRISSRVVFYDD